MPPCVSHNTHVLLSWNVLPFLSSSQGPASVSPSVQILLWSTVPLNFYSLSHWFQLNSLLSTAVDCFLLFSRSKSTNFELWTLARGNVAFTLTLCSMLLSWAHSPWHTKVFWSIHFITILFTWGKATWNRVTTPSSVGTAKGGTNSIPYLNHSGKGHFAPPGAAVAGGQPGERGQLPNSS